MPLKHLNILLVTAGRVVVITDDVGKRKAKPAKPALDVDLITTPPSLRPQHRVRRKAKIVGASGDTAHPPRHP